jgi:hypothetical protein
MIPDSLPVSISGAALGCKHHSSEPFSVDHTGWLTYPLDMVLLHIIHMANKAFYVIIFFFSLQFSLGGY